MKNSSSIFLHLLSVLSLIIGPVLPGLSIPVARAQAAAPTYLVTVSTGSINLELNYQNMPAGLEYHIVPFGEANPAKKKSSKSIPAGNGKVSLSVPLDSNFSGQVAIYQPTQVRYVGPRVSFTSSLLQVTVPPTSAVQTISDLGGTEPTPTATPTPTPASTPAPTPTAAPTPAPTATPTPSATPTPTAAPAPVTGSPTFRLTTDLYKINFVYSNLPAGLTLRTVNKGQQVTNTFVTSQSIPAGSGTVTAKLPLTATVDGEVVVYEAVRDRYIGPRVSFKYSLLKFAPAPSTETFVIQELVPSPTPTPTPTPTPSAVPTPTATPTPTPTPSPAPTPVSLADVDLYITDETQNSLDNNVSPDQLVLLGIIDKALQQTNLTSSELSLATGAREFAMNMARLDTLALELSSSSLSLREVYLNDVRDQIVSFTDNIEANNASDGHSEHNAAIVQASTMALVSAETKWERMMDQYQQEISLQLPNLKSDSLSFGSVSFIDDNASMKADMPLPNVGGTLQLRSWHDLLPAVTLATIDNSADSSLTSTTRLVSLDFSQTTHRVTKMSFNSSAPLTISGYRRGQNVYQEEHAAGQITIEVPEGMTSLLLALPDRRAMTLADVVITGDVHKDQETYEVLSAKSNKQIGLARARNWGKVETILRSTVWNGFLADNNIIHYRADGSTGASVNGKLLVDGGAAQHYSLIKPESLSGAAKFADSLQYINDDGLHGLDHEFFTYLNGAIVVHPGAPGLLVVKVVEGGDVRSIRTENKETFEEVAEQEAFHPSIGVEKLYLGPVEGEEGFSAGVSGIVDTRTPVIPYNETFHFLGLLRNQSGESGSVTVDVYAGPGEDPLARHMGTFSTTLGAYEMKTLQANANSPAGEEPPSVTLIMTLPGGEQVDYSKKARVPTADTTRIVNPDCQDADGCNGEPYLVYVSEDRVTDNKRRYERALARAKAAAKLRHDANNPYFFDNIWNFEEGAKETEQQIQETGTIEVPMEDGSNVILGEQDVDLPQDAELTDAKKEQMQETGRNSTTTTRNNVDQAIPAQLSDYRDDLEQFLRELDSLANQIDPTLVATNVKSLPLELLLHSALELWNLWDPEVLAEEGSCEGTCSYYISRPLMGGERLVENALGEVANQSISHNFIVTHATYLGDPKAHVHSYAMQKKDGCTRGIDCPLGMVNDQQVASDDNKDTYTWDRASWLSLATIPDTAKHIIGAVAIPAASETVESLAQNLIPDNPYNIILVLADGHITGSNSNTAAQAVVNKAMCESVEFVPSLLALGKYVLARPILLPRDGVRYSPGWDNANLINFSVTNPNCP